MTSATPTNEELSTLAYAEPPTRPEGLARILYLVIVTFLVLTTITVGLRASFMVCCVFATYTTQFNISTPDSKLNGLLKIRAAEYVFYWQICYAISALLVKASIGVAMLRLTTRRRYRYPLWAVMLIPAATTFAGTVMLLTVCTPVAAQWNPSLGTCKSRVTISIVSSSFTVVAIITDLSCAIIPYFIVKDLQMPRHTKTSLVLILGLGLFASLGAIVRAPYLRAYNATHDQLLGYANILIWSFVENGIGIVTGSLLPLRKLFGVYFETRSASLPDFAQAGAKHTIGGTPLTLLPSNDRHSGSDGKLKDDNSSSRGIVQETIEDVDSRSVSDVGSRYRHQTEISARV